MFLDSIEYVATLIEFVSRQTGMTVAETTIKICRERIFNLCHNAPMNRLLPIEKIAKEVIGDNYLPGCAWNDCVVANFEYGKAMAGVVFKLASSQKEYVDILVDLLQKEGA